MGTYRHPAADDVLAALTAGPLTLAELTELLLSGRLGAASLPDDVDPAAYLDACLLDTPGIWSHADVHYSTAYLLDGTTFTHPVSAGEIAAGAVDVMPDLVATDLSAKDSLPLAGGGRLEVIYDDTDAPGILSLRSAPGWLDDFGADDMLAVSFRNGLVEIGRNPALGDGANESAALAAAVADRQRRPDEGVFLMPVVLDVLATDRTLFRAAVPPIGDLLGAARLEARGESIGPADTEWESPDVSMRRDRQEYLRRQWGFGDCCEEAFDAVLEAWFAFLFSDVGQVAAAEVAAHLLHGSVAPAFAEHVFEVDHEGSRQLDDFATAVIAGSGRRAAAAHFLRALNFDRASDARAVETDLRAALDLHPDYPPALEEMARFALDRGDGAQALRLLRQAGVAEDDPEIGLLASMFEKHAGVGRNEPCPCGSGRKFKACCQRGPRLSDADQVKLLTHKIRIFGSRGLRSDDHIGLAMSAMPDDFDVEDLAEMAHDSFIHDLAALQPETTYEYLEQRGHLLTDEERDLLDLWGQVDFALWEVIAVAPGRTLTLRDTKTGDVVEVEEVLGSGQAVVGDYLLARVVPAFAKSWIIGETLGVDLLHRDSLLEVLDGYVDADVLAGWYGRARTPPRFSNREGDPLVFCVARLQPGRGGWEKLTAQLDEVFDRLETDEWSESHTLPDGDTVLRATLRRDGDELVVETNSEPRLERVLTALQGVRLVDEVRTPASRPKDLERLRSSEDEPWEPPAEASEILATAVEAMEDRWLDEQIPLLGGSTPREAATDPTRRPDLLALLRRLDRPAPVGSKGMGFDAARIRRKLGLD